MPTTLQQEPVKVIKAILDGSYGKPPLEPLPDKTMDDFWRSKFESPSVPDDRHIDIPPTLDALAEKITLDEFKIMRKTPKESSAGLDGIPVDLIRSKTLDADLCIFYNLFLLHSTTPSTLTRGVTSLIPKEDQPTSPAEFRPITVSSTILRLFHKILASTLDRIPIYNAQKGFRTMDGICENIILSKSLIKRAQKESKPLCICLLDIKKAFDSVSHESL